jgi:hypothetical protein
MTEQLRRAAPRQSTDWSAMYRFDSDQSETWRTCRILDISPMGAGLQLYDVLPGELLDGNVTISFELRGIGRNLIRADDGTTARFGIEFPEYTEAARELFKKTNGASY